MSTSFTPEDVTKVLVAHDYSLVSDNKDDEIPVLRFRIRRVLTTVRFHDRVAHQHLFETAVLTCTLPALSGHAARQVDSSIESGSDRKAASTLNFSGGVTAEWLSKRAGAWKDLIVDRLNRVQRLRHNVERH